MGAIWSFITGYSWIMSVIWFSLSFIVGVFSINMFRGARRDRQRVRVENIPQNVIHTSGQNVASLTEQCYRIGSYYSTNNIPLVNQSQQTVWEQVQQELMDALNSAHDRNHEAILRARSLRSPTEQLMDMINVSTTLQRQSNICRGCRNRQTNDRFVCNLANSRNIAGMDENGNIHIN